MKYDASWCRFYPNRFYKIIIFLCIVYSFLHVIVIWILVRRAAVTGKSILLHKHLIFLHLPLKLNTMLQSQLIFSSLYSSYTNIKFIFWSDKNPQTSQQPDIGFDFFLWKLVTMIEVEMECQHWVSGREFNWKRSFMDDLIWFLATDGKKLCKFWGFFKKLQNAS